jgi:hypothetical protein
VYKGTIEQALTKISRVFTDPMLIDTEALLGLLLCECRLIYLNKDSWDFALNRLEGFKANHQALKLRIADKTVKECVNDVLLLVFDN